MDQLTDLFRMYLVNYQNFLVWKCYFSAILVRIKLSRRGMAVTTTCPQCVRHRETVLYAFVEYSEMGDFITFAERILSLMERVQLSTESVIKTVHQLYLHWGKVGFFFPRDSHTE